jgi:hypothetical protein
VCVRPNNFYLDWSIWMWNYISNYKFKDWVNKRNGILLKDRCEELKDNRIKNKKMSLKLTKKLRFKVGCFFISCLLSPMIRILWKLIKYDISSLLWNCYKRNDN